MSLFSTYQRIAAVSVTVLVLAATVAVFVFFDRDSHSASDTLRPVALTMLPAWILAVVVLRSLLGGHGSRIVAEEPKTDAGRNGYNRSG